MKAEHPGMSVCEVGARIGRFWRELSDSEKQHYVCEFTIDKVSVMCHYFLVDFTFRFAIITYISYVFFNRSLVVAFDLTYPPIGHD